VVDEMAAYLTSHEEDVTADGHPSEWTEEEWSDCGNAQYAKWAGVGDGRAKEWAQGISDDVAVARGEEPAYKSTGDSGNASESVRKDEPLRETDEGFEVELADGTVIPVEGTRGDLHRFGGRPLAILEEKGENVEQFLVEEEPPEAAAESTRERRAGMDIHHPRRLRDDTFLISMKNVAQPAEGSAGPALVQRGREKALEEAGGQQAIPTFWLMVATGLLAVVGFGMGYGALLL